MNELTDIILKKTKESSELVKNVEVSPYLESYDYHTKAKQALDYLNVLKNFYNFVNKDEGIEKRALKTLKIFFIQPYIEDLNGLEELLEACKDVNKFEKKTIKRCFFIAGFSSLGLFLNPVFAVPTVTCLCACIYPSYKIRQVNKYRQNFIKRIKKDKVSIEYWDSVKLDELKQVLLDNKGEIKRHLK